MAKTYFPTNYKNMLEVIRGTTKTFSVNITDANGDPYSLASGDVVRFGVKQESGDEAYLIEKEVTEGEGGVFAFTIAPEDTINLEPGHYKYDVGLQTGEDYFNVIPYSRFVLTPNVTEKE